MNYKHLHEALDRIKVLEAEKEELHHTVHTLSIRLDILRRKLEELEAEASPVFAT